MAAGYKVANLPLEFRVAGSDFLVVHSGMVDVAHRALEPYELLLGLGNGEVR